jgi:hypothetical protein
MLFALFTVLILLSISRAIGQTVIRQGARITGNIIIGGFCGATCDAAMLDSYANIAASACNSSNSGQLALTTDSIYTARCNGTSWDWFWRGISVTPPPKTGWTLEADPGATTTANSDGTVTFYFPARSTIKISAAYRTGASTQTVTALVCSVFGDVVFGSADAVTDPSTAADSLAVRDAAGKYSAYFWTVNVGNGYFTSLDYWTSTTVYSGTAFAYPNAAEGAPSSAQLQKEVNQDCHWFRVVEDSTNDSWQYNYTGSGNNWVQFIQKSKTDFLASGTHSPAIVGYTNRVGMRITLVSWKQE